MRSFVLFGLFFFAAIAGTAQTPFPERCLGIWKGDMTIYGNGEVKDRVPVRMTISKTSKPGEYTWKTEYLSKKLPVTKNYLLRVKDLAKGIYITDEGDGTELLNYQAGDKLYNVFETGGILLTATYELRGKELIFEVTSGKKPSPPDDPKSVIAHPVTSVQRAALKRSK